MTTARRMEGRSAVITGGGAGIGAAVARLFCEQGASVLLIDREAGPLAAVADTLKNGTASAKVATVVCDIADRPALADAIAQAARLHGHVDTLVNNAAARHHGRLDEASDDDWEALLSVNLLGTAAACRAALPELRRSGRGAVVNVSSCYAVKGRVGMGLYDTSKAGLLAFTRTLAAEESQHGIRVNAVCPGSTLTEFHRARAASAGTPLEVLKTQRQATSILGRWAEPQEIAWPVLWLASDEASYITGTTLLVDGGLHAI